jgi:hypothetical protein
VVVTNGMMIPNYSKPDDWERFNALGVTQYGQMTAGSYMYIGPQGIVHGTAITVLNAVRKIGKSKSENGLPLFVTSGLGKGVVRAHDTPNFIAAPGFASKSEASPRPGTHCPSANLRRGEIPTAALLRMSISKQRRERKGRPSTRRFSRGGFESVGPRWTMVLWQRRRALASLARLFFPGPVGRSFSGSKFPDGEGFPPGRQNPRRNASDQAAMPEPGCWR